MIATATRRDRITTGLDHIVLTDYLDGAALGNLEAASHAYLVNGHDDLFFSAETACRAGDWLRAVSPFWEPQL